MSVLLVIFLAAASAGQAETDDDQVAAPTSHWASVYTSDTTDYRQPVRDQVYPLVKDVSRSDWFNSYPYHKFEERKEEETGEPGILENVAKAVGSVRQKITDFGDDVFNSALGLVGAEKTDDGYQERDGPQISPKFPREREELSVDGNTVRPAFVQPDPVSPIEQFRLGVRSYLDPIVDPMVDPIKHLFKSDEVEDHERKQNIFPSPIAAMNDFGKRVAGGFSRLSRLSSPSKVSSVLFPWLVETTEESEASDGSSLARSQTDILAESESLQHSVRAQYYDGQTNLPLLPPVFIPPILAPEQQVAQATTHHHHHPTTTTTTGPALKHPLDILGLIKRPLLPPFNWPRKHRKPVSEEEATIIVNPPAAARSQYSLSQISDRQPLNLLITPIVKAALRRKKAGVRAEPSNANVMYYLPPPDLSSGPGYEDFYQDIFHEEIVDDSINEIGSYDVINYLETKPDLKDIEDVGQTTTINLSPDTSSLETIIVDISQDLPQVYYETSEQAAYNDLLDTQDTQDAIPDSTDSPISLGVEEYQQDEEEAVLEVNQEEDSV